MRCRALSFNAVSEANNHCQIDEDEPTLHIWTKKKTFINDLYIHKRAQHIYVYIYLCVYLIECGKIQLTIHIYICMYTHEYL